MERHYTEQFAFFAKSNEQNVDAARFFNLAKGLHSVTRFENSDARHNLDTQGNFIQIVDQYHVLVNGAGKSVDVLAKRDLSKVTNLDTEGQMAFCAAHADNLLFLGCNKGHLYNFNSMYGFSQKNFTKLDEAISNMLILQSQKKVGQIDDAPKYLLCVQDTGKFDLLTFTEEPKSVAQGFFNNLSKIQTIIQLPNDPDDANYIFVIASIVGIYFLTVSKENFQMKLTKECYLKNKVVNKILLRGKFIVAFVHENAKFYVIDREKKDVIHDQKWPYEDLLSCTGVDFAPAYHPEEMSIIFLRDPKGIRIINTQTWHVSTLIRIEDGEKFADLKLLQVESEDDHGITIYTFDKNDKQLVKKSFSKLLKYCLQTTSLRASTKKNLITNKIYD